MKKKKYNNLCQKDLKRLQSTHLKGVGSYLYDGHALNFERKPLALHLKSKQGQFPLTWAQKSPSLSSIV